MARPVYIRPILEHNSVVWYPHLIQHIMRIEKVQRHFTKRLRGFRNLCYADRLALQLPRLQLDLIYCYKIVFGLVKLNSSDFFEFSSVTNTRRHAHKLYKSRCSNIRVNFLSSRVVNVWNSLPESVSFVGLPVLNRI